MSVLNPFPQQDVSLLMSASEQFFRHFGQQKLKVIFILKQYDSRQILYEQLSIKYKVSLQLCTCHKSSNILRINLCPWRENKFTAANSPLVSSLPPSQCFPE